MSNAVEILESLYDDLLTGKHFQHSHTEDRAGVADRVASALAALKSPEPDWSAAPEWAQWWAVSAASEAFWYAAEPKPINHMGHWARPMTNSRDSMMRRAGRIDLPLGTDWRLTLRERPEDTQ